MSTQALLDARVSQLEIGAEPPLAAGRAAIGRIAAAVTLLAAAFASPTVIVAHYVPMYVPGCQLLLRW